MRVNLGGHSAGTSVHLAPEADSRPRAPYGGSHFVASSQPGNKSSRRKRMGRGAPKLSCVYKMNPNTRIENAETSTAGRRKSSCVAEGNCEDPGGHGEAAGGARGLGIPGPHRARQGKARWLAGHGSDCSKPERGEGQARQRQQAVGITLPRSVILTRRRNREAGDCGGSAWL